MTLCITGWLKDDDGVTKPWTGAGQFPFDGSEMYALRWETKELKELGAFVQDAIKKQARSKSLMLLSALPSWSVAW